GEIAIGLGMRSEHLDIRKAVSLEGGDHRCSPHPVQGGVENLEFTRPLRRLGEYRLNEGTIDLLLAQFNFSRGEGLVEVAPLDRLGRHHPFDNSRVVWR